ncbi:hypothetical protein LINGRAHAP2_LOCUS9294 [Linum grandiflorum]
MKEMEMGKNWIKKVLEEKKGVIEEQMRVIKEKGVEIEGLMKSNGLVVNGDELKEAMVSDPMRALEEEGVEELRTNLVSDPMGFRFVVWVVRLGFRF